MENLIYNNIIAVLQLNKAGELIQKRMKAAKVCDGLYLTAPDRTQFTNLIIEFNGVKWIEHSVPAENINTEHLAKRMPTILASIEGGRLNTLNDYHKELHRRIFNPEQPAIMVLKQPERKKATQQPEVATKIDGTFRAKVLQYKQDGNTLTEKWKTLTKLCDGVYYNREQDAWDNWHYVIFFEDNGVFWYSLRALTQNQFNNPQERERIINLRNNFRAHIKETAQNNGYIRNLEIEAFKRLGEDTAPLVASREAYLKHREEEDRQRAEEEARREQQRKEAEERRKAELLADGKEKLMTNKAVTVEQIELLAEAVGYKIHIRTIGFMREKVSEAVLDADGTITVWGHKLTQRNISGTADVLREIAARNKARAEAEAQQPITATETPEISTDSAEVEKVPTEGEKREETAKYERINIRDYMQRLGQKLIAYRDMPEVDDFSRRGNMAVIYQSPGGIYYCAYLWYNVAGEILRSDYKQYKRQKSAMDYMLFTDENLAINPICELEIKADTPNDEYDYYQWMKEADEGNYRTIAEKALIEAWCNIFLAAYRRGSGHVLAMNKYGELVDTVFYPSQPSTPPPEAVQNFRTTGQPAKLPQ